MSSAFEIVETATGEVVKTINTTGKGERARDRIEMGILRQMDFERFFVRETKEKTNV